MSTYFGLNAANLTSVARELKCLVLQGPRLGFRVLQQIRGEPPKLSKIDTDSLVLDNNATEYCTSGLHL